MIQSPDLPGDETRSRGLHGVAGLLPFLVGVAVGLPSLNGAFIRDDWDYIHGNPQVACATSLRDVFKSPFQPLETLGLYRPVTTLSLRLDASLGGEQRPWIFHATNLLLAGLSAALVALLTRTLALRRYGKDAATRAALAAGLLFAVHPARTEAVCWISGRAENLMTFFSLLALVLASGPVAFWRMVLAAACSVLAAWSKEQGFMLALLVPVVAPPVNGRRLVQTVVVFAGLGLAFIARWGTLGGLSLQKGLAVFEDLSFGERVAQGLRLLFEYVRVALWPHPLLFEYDNAKLRAAAGFADVRVIAGLAALLLLLAAIACLRRLPLVAAGAALFLFPLLPVLNVFVRIGEDFAERFLALPIAGLALVLGAFAARWKAAGFGIGMLIVGICGALFTLRAADYKSERTMYEALFERVPDSAAAKTLLASTLLLPDGGTKRPVPHEAAKAETLLREAVAADPGYVVARVTLATVEAQRRAAAHVPPLPADVEFLIDNTKRFPLQTQVHGMLGVAFYERNVPDLARPELEKELEIMPFDFTAASYLARILEEKRQEDRAREVIDAIRKRWEALWKRYPGFAPVAVTYARTLSDGARDVDGARKVLREAQSAACRPSDRRAIEKALEDLGVKGK